MKEYSSSVSPKGQVTIPLEIRKLLGVKPKDRVTFTVDGQQVRIQPLGSRLAASYRAVPPLKNSLTLTEMADIAHEEHAQDAAREGL